MIFIGWAHLIAAVAWIGGMLFLSLVLVPVFKREAFSGERRSLFQALARRFRILSWTSIIVLLLTGLILLIARSESSAEDARWGVVLTAKLGLVVILLSLTALHDFWLGPRMMSAQGSSPEYALVPTNTLARLSPWIARLALLLSLVILYLGITIAKT